MWQSQQSLHSPNLPIHVVLQLIVQPKSSALQHRPNMILNPHVLQHVRIRTLHSQNTTSSSVSLGTVHCGVSVLPQLYLSLAMVWINCAPDTCTEQSWTLLNVHRRREQLHESFGDDSYRSHTLYFTQDDGELICSGSGNCIHSSQAPGEHCCHSLQALISTNRCRSVIVLLHFVDA